MSLVFRGSWKRTRSRRRRGPEITKEDITTLGSCRRSCSSSVVHHQSKPQLHVNQQKQNIRGLRRAPLNRDRGHGSCSSLQPWHSNQLAKPEQDELSRSVGDLSGPTFVRAVSILGSHGYMEPGHPTLSRIRAASTWNFKREPREVGKTESRQSA